MALLIANDYYKPVSVKHLVCLSECLALRGGMKVYLTAVDGDEDDRETAQRQSGIELITPQVDSAIPKEDPNSKWLIFHEVYFPQLSNMPDVRMVLGFYPTTIVAAHRIWTKHYQDLPFVICFAEITESPFGSSQLEKSSFEICQQQASAFLSLGLRVHDHYIGQFSPSDGNRAHFCYLPSFNLGRSHRTAFNTSPGSEIHILTPVFDTEGSTATQVTQSLQWKILSLAVGMVANAYDDFGVDQLIVWSVYGICPQDTAEVQDFLKHQCDSDYLKIDVISSDHSHHLEDFITRARLCLACLHTASNDFVCGQVLSHGTPSLFSEQSNFGCLIKRHFRQWSDNFLVGFPTNCNGDKEMKNFARGIKKRIISITKNPDIAFKKMGEFRNEFLECIDTGEIGVSQKNFHSWCSKQGIKQVDESRNSITNNYTTKRALEEGLNFSQIKKYCTPLINCLFCKLVKVPK